MNSSTIDNVAKQPLPVLQLVDVQKKFGDFTAVKNISLDVLEGEFLTIVGPSGSGKTTMLRMLAGMEAPSSGNITLRGRRSTTCPLSAGLLVWCSSPLRCFPTRRWGKTSSFH